MYFIIKDTNCRKQRVQLNKIKDAKYKTQYIYL